MLEFKRPNIRKIIEINNDHILISPLYLKGYNATSKKTTKKTTPKLLLDAILLVSNLNL